jgi:hypothetical protein
MMALSQPTPKHVAADRPSLARLEYLPSVARLRLCSGRNPSLVDARLVSELAGDLEGIDACGLPPGALVTGPVDLAMVHPAERDGEFIARLARRA